MARTFILSLLHWTLIYGECPPLGPILPAPTELSQNEFIQELSTQINAQLQNTSSLLNQTALSVGVRSVHEDKPLLSFHYTPEEFNSSGTDKIDGDTVYRIGSVTKLFTALSILQLEDKINLSDPVTKYVPKLHDVSNSNDSLSEVDWNSVSIEALLTHMAGVPSDISGGAIQQPVLGLPPLPESQQSLPCGNAPDQPGCSWDDFFNNIGRTPSVYRPFTTPVYSNVGYGLLGLVIENVSGQSYADYVEQNIVTKAGMKQTTVTDAPASELGFIPAEPNWWGTSLGYKNSAGSMYASNNDLLSFGTAILSDKLLDPAQTRAWMKPSTFTSSMGVAVGGPWEITRGPNLTTDGRVIDFYAKTGDVGDYSAILVLVPDYGLTIAMNFAGPSSEPEVTLGIFSQLVEALIPVVDQIGKGQAMEKLTGTFAAAPNSSLELSVDDFGLLVSNFSANGEDVASQYPILTPGESSDDVPPPATIRLYPTNLQAGNQSAWRAVYTTGTADDIATADAQLFFPQGSCQTWLRLDRINYGLESLDYFVLTEDDSGKIVAVEPRAWRLLLERTQ